jgi:MOSC domain-containing protein YiiM
MKVISTNIGDAVTFEWNGATEQTGIFKYPTSKSLFLTKNDVKDDTVIDRVHHGGTNKACYLFSADYYDYWKNLYPNLKWDWGMFGENLTVEGLVSAGDEMILVEQSINTFTSQQFYELMFAKEKSKDLLELFMTNEAVPQYKKDRFMKYLS